MNKLTIYYCVTNGGDGSAYPSFFESKELAEWDEEHDGSWWAESSVGDISFESDSPIVCVDEIITKEAYFIDKYLEDYSDETEERDEFLQKFFPNGFPKCTSTVEKLEKTSYSDRIYSYHHIFVDGKEVAKMFIEQSVSAEEVLERLHNFSK